MSKHTFKEIWDQLQKSTLFKIARIIGNSAAIALLITAILFVYQEHEERDRTDKIINNLQGISVDMMSIQHSLSTRYIGIFPGFIQEVNILLEGCPTKDSIIIFEDVLHYGFISSPKEFVRMNQLLIEHADKGGQVIIVYYDEDKRTFHRINRESLISPSYYASMERERKIENGKLEAEGRSSVEQLKVLDTLLCHKYFNLSRDHDLQGFKAKIAHQTSSQLGPISKAMECSSDITEMCFKIDSIRHHWLSEKKPTVIDFFDYEYMYRSITQVMKSYYHAHGMNLCAMDEYLTMSCWLVGNRAVLAFPSKWSSDEIGFFSQDPAFAQYIKTMLMGVQSSL